MYLVIDLICYIFLDKLLAWPIIDQLIFQGQVILSSLNQSVIELNHIIIACFLGTLQIYNSINSIDLDKNRLKELSIKYL